MQDKENETKNVNQLDAAGKSLTEALTISFAILKVIMIVLVVAFLASGFKMVESDEQAIVLQFGKIRGVGEDRLLGPGPHWVWPYPINEIIKIPVAKNINLAVNSFWYFQKPSELLPQGPKDHIRVPADLDPVIDGYCITRSEKQNTSAFTGSDYNIVHSKWQLTYKIDDPEKFFKNVYVDDVQPGQSYSEVMTKSITPLLEKLIADVVVNAMVNYTIDEAISSEDRIPRNVKKLLQKKFNAIECGLTVVSVQLTDITWPRQVDRAFLNSIKSRQFSETLVSQAKGYAENTLNEAAGPVGPELLAAIKNENVGESEMGLLWSQLAGAAQEKIAGARAYRTKVVETAKSNAEYLQKILPEYQKRPQLVIQQIYQDAIKQVLDNTDEKIIIQPTENAKSKEIRILLNRDPAIKSKPKQD
ncbi:MAG: hypothetical protein KAQ89_04210 [Planctomycetes bacterium]|nr:hypothetical protein [Planctomycetota bacterium]